MDVILFLKNTQNERRQPCVAHIFVRNQKFVSVKSFFISSKFGTGLLFRYQFVYIERRLGFVSWTTNESGQEEDGT